MIIDERLDLKNFIHDGNEFQIIKQLIMKSRHKFLMPILILNLTQKKKKYKTGYKTSFSKNVHERTDAPVFTIEDAISHIMDKDASNRTAFEVALDQFYMKNLPKRVLDHYEAKDKLVVIRNKFRVEKQRLTESPKYVLSRLNVNNKVIVRSNVIRIRTHRKSI